VYGLEFRVLGVWFRGAQLVTAYFTRTPTEREGDIKRYRDKERQRERETEREGERRETCFSSSCLFRSSLETSDQEVNAPQDEDSDTPVSGQSRFRRARLGTVWILKRGMGSFSPRRRPQTDKTSTPSTTPPPQVSRMAGQQVAYGQGVQLQHSSGRFLSVKKNRAVHHKIAMVPTPHPKPSHL